MEILKKQLNCFYIFLTSICAKLSLSLRSLNLLTRVKVKGGGGRRNKSGNSSSYSASSLTICSPYWMKLSSPLPPFHFPVASCALQPAWNPTWNSALKSACIGPAVFWNLNANETICVEMTNSTLLQQKLPHDKTLGILPCKIVVAQVIEFSWWLRVKYMAKSLCQPFSKWTSTMSCLEGEQDILILPGQRLKLDKTKLASTDGHPPPLWASGWDQGLRKVGSSCLGEGWSAKTRSVSSPAPQLIDFWSKKRLW